MTWKIGLCTNIEFFYQYDFDQGGMKNSETWQLIKGQLVLGRIDRI